MRSLLAILLILLAVPQTHAQDDAQRAKDARIVRTLLRLPGVDLADKPEAKAALLRYLDEQKGTEEYLQIVEKFSLRETKDELLRLAIEQADGTLGVKAAGLLVKFGETDLLKKAIADPDPAKGAKVVGALGLLADAKTNDLLTPLRRRCPATADHSRGRGRCDRAQRAGAEVAPSDRRAREAAADLKFAAANVLLSSADEAIKTAAGKHLSLPAGAGGEPLPPVAELVKRTGDAARGKELFAGIGTCAKCHQVRGEGKTSRRRPVGNRQQALARGDVRVDPRSQRRHQRRLRKLPRPDDRRHRSHGHSRQPDRRSRRTQNGRGDRPQAPPRRHRPDEETVASLMPADLQKQLKAQDLVDIVAYLTTLKKAN